MELRPIDADHHYYESLDAFTRHLDKAFRERGVRPVQDGKRVTMLMGGRENHFIPNPTFDPIIVAGCLDPMFRGQVPEGVDPRSLPQVEPLHAEYRDRDARLAVVEEQGLDAIMLFPTLGCGVEEALREDVDATMASLHAFNRWLEDDWGYAYGGRLIAAPMISLADPDAAGAEVDRVLGLGARVVHVRPAPVPTPEGGGRSLGHALHDPVWARLAEAGVPVAFHLGDSGYNRTIAAAWGSNPRMEPFRAPDVLGRVLVADRAIHDTMASLIVDQVFHRHPGLKVASIENGSYWVPLLAQRLKKQANQTPWAFPDHPIDVLRQHVWVTPYYEEDLAALIELIGVERVLFGSDWPHGEGLAQPLDFTKELQGFDDHTHERVLRANAVDLLRPAA
jgi:predicted TIM-barrel fold metal-dependent hydrolase